MDWRSLATDSLGGDGLITVLRWRRQQEGSGFIGAFVGGLLFGGLVKRHKRNLLRAAEGTAETFALLTWVLFGAGCGRADSYLKLPGPFCVIRY